MILYIIAFQGLVSIGLSYNYTYTNNLTDPYLSLEYLPNGSVARHRTYELPTIHFAEFRNDPVYVKVGGGENCLLYVQFGTPIKSLTPST